VSKCREHRCPDRADPDDVRNEGELTRAAAGDGNGGDTGRGSWEKTERKREDGVDARSVAKRMQNGMPRRGTRIEHAFFQGSVNRQGSGMAGKSPVTTEFRSPGAAGVPVGSSGPLALRGARSRQGLAP